MKTINAIHLRQRCQTVQPFGTTSLNPAPKKEAELLTGLVFGGNLTDMSVRKRNKEATEAAIIEAAVATFRRDGYAKARVSDIVGKCGLSQGAFYLYFRSKEQVLRRIMR